MELATLQPKRPINTKRRGVRKKQRIKDLLNVPVCTPHRLVFSLWYLHLLRRLFLLLNYGLCTVFALMLLFYNKHSSLIPKFGSGVGPCLSLCLV